MSFKKETIELPRRTKRVYSEAELKEFDTLVNKHRYIYKARNGEELRAINWTNLHKELGTMTDKGVVVESIGYDKDGSINFADIPYEEVENKISQWQRWRTKTDRFEARRLEGLEQVAKSVPQTFEANVDQAESDLHRARIINEELNK